MEEKIVASLLGLSAFGVYFGVSIGLLILFALFYAMVTPYAELTLIREGNTAAACSYSGALLGFSLPLASAVEHSVSLTDMIIWGLVALVIQVTTFFVVKLIFPTIVQDIPHNQVAKGIFLGVMSLTVGIINAACMTY
jgi:putative membrane protein